MCLPAIAMLEGQLESTAYTVRRSPVGKPLDPLWRNNWVQIGTVLWSLSWVTAAVRVIRRLCDGGRPRFHRLIPDWGYASVAFRE